MSVALKKGIPFWSIALLFSVALLVATFSRLPASLLLGVYPGVEGRFEGTLYNATSRFLKLGGVTLENVTFEVSPLSVFTGRYEGRVRVSGRDAVGQTQFHQQEQLVNLAELDFQFQAPISIWGHHFSTTTRFESTEISIKNNACIKGQVAIASDALKVFFEELGLEGAPVLSGLGICNKQGDVRLNLQGTSNLVSAELQGHLQGSDLLADIALLPRGPMPEMLLGMMQASGFKFDGKTITGQVNIQLTPNI